MAAELEKLARQYPYMRGVYQDLADRVREEDGPEVIRKTALSESPSIQEIGEAILQEHTSKDEEVAYRPSGLLVLNAARLLPRTEDMPRVKIRLKEGSNYLVIFEGRELRLGSTEYELLTFFSMNPNRAFSTEEIGNKLGRFNRHWVTVNINRLRAKTEEDPKNPTRLVTFGTGGRIGFHMFMIPERNGSR